MVPWYHKVRRGAAAALLVKTGVAGIRTQTMVDAELKAIAG